MTHHSSKHPADQIRAISCDIAAHLIEEPERQDTFEGLASWWLMERDLARYTDLIRAATNDLVERGFLNKTVRADGRAHYNLNKLKVEEIQRFLAQSSGQEETVG